MNTRITLSLGLAGVLGQAQALLQEVAGVGRVAVLLIDLTEDAIDRGQPGGLGIAFLDREEDRVLLDRR